VARWQGIVLALIGVVATVWLALTDRLGLYIHPRYSVFTVVMALIAAVLVIVAFAMTPVSDDDEHEHEHEHDGHGHGSDHDHGDDHEHGADPDLAAVPSRRGETVRAVLAGAIVVGATVALLVLPPATLTSATATQRAINSGGTTLVSADAPTLVGGDTSQFTVKDWALLLRQNPDAEYFSGKTIDVTGFVTASPDDPENVFYVSRFVVTCCAVDAQPVGVPVYLPGWDDRFDPDQWVTASGAFQANPGSSSAEPLLLEPADLAPTDQPAQPYVF